MNAQRVKVKVEESVPSLCLFNPITSSFIVAAGTTLQVRAEPQCQADGHTHARARRNQCYSEETGTKVQEFYDCAATEITSVCFDDRCWHWCTAAGGRMLFT